MKDFLIFVLFLAAFVSAKAQGQIKGMVTDAKGNPVIGAKITEIGPGNHTFTYLNGAYVFNYSSKNPVLRISSDGYISKEMKLSEFNGSRIRLVRAPGLDPVAGTTNSTTRQGGFFKRIFRKTGDS